MELSFSVIAENTRKLRGALNLKTIITAPKRQKLEEGNEQSRGLEENKERHERNLCLEQRVLNILHWLLQIGHPKLIDSLTFVSLRSDCL